MSSRTPTDPRPVKRRKRTRASGTASFTSFLFDTFAFMSAFGITILAGFMGYVIGNALDGRTGRIAGASLDIAIVLGLFMINAFRRRPNDSEEQYQERQKDKRPAFRRAIDTFTGTFPRLRGHS